MPMDQQTAPAPEKTAKNHRVRAAVHRHKRFSKEGILERAFTFAFRGLVYPQIWEDPEIDLEAMQVAPGARIVTIASGGCNALSYLTADPAQITAVDLNPAHIALNKLKLCAVSKLPDHAAFFSFFGRADEAANLVLYNRYIKSHLDAESRAYWESRNIFGRRRIGSFTRNFYKHGLLGNFMGAGHLVAKLYGRDPARMLDAHSLREQRVIFERELAPIFDKKLVRWLTSHPASLYGLGIPPAQYRALAGSGAHGIAPVLRARLERLACDFDIQKNYFAWQAFGRRYADDAAASLPPYLQERNFDVVRERAGRIAIRHVNFIDFLKDNPDKSLDRYVLLDAQDWMNDAVLTSLWGEITRTAKPGARVIFRTAAEETLLPGRVPDDILGRWSYEESASRAFTARDRSSIYGGFHLYTLRGALH
jgi:S-adenosylmethionine-diacylglycerol 3-amino-3-carboxypropyl transferase